MGIINFPVTGMIWYGFSMKTLANRGRHDGRQGVTAKAAFLGILILGLISGPLVLAKDLALSPALVGNWDGKAQIIVSWCQQQNLPIHLKVLPDGSVTGKVGDATLSKGQLKKNRGRLGRWLKVKTDYIIVGDLKGPIVSAESIQRSGVKIPFNLKGGTMVGGVHTTGSKFGGKKSMKLSAASMALLRQPKEKQGETK